MSDENGVSSSSSPKKFKCNLCRFKTTSSKGFKIHFQVKHKKDSKHVNDTSKASEDIKCSYCSYKTKQKVCYTDHLRFHHKAATSEKQNKTAKGLNGRPKSPHDVLCQLCDRIFKNVKFLMVHLLDVHSVVPNSVNDPAQWESLTRIQRKQLMIAINKSKPVDKRQKCSETSQKNPTVKMRTRSQSSKTCESETKHSKVSKAIKSGIKRMRVTLKRVRKQDYHGTSKSVMSPRKKSIFDIKNPYSEFVLNSRLRAYRSAPSPYSDSDKSDSRELIPDLDEIASRSDETLSTSKECVDELVKSNEVLSISKEILPQSNETLPRSDEMSSKDTCLQSQETLSTQVNLRTSEILRTERMSSNSDATVLVDEMEQRSDDMSPMSDQTMPEGDDVRSVLSIPEENQIEDLRVEYNCGLCDFTIQSKDSSAIFAHMEAEHQVSFQSEFVSEVRSENNISDPLQGQASEVEGQVREDEGQASEVEDQLREVEGQEVEGQEVRDVSHNLDDQAQELEHRSDNTNSSPFRQTTDQIESGTDVISLRLPSKSEQCQSTNMIDSPNRPSKTVCSHTDDNTITNSEISHQHNLYQPKDITNPMRTLSQPVFDQVQERTRTDSESSHQQVYYQPAEDRTIPPSEFSQPVIHISHFRMETDNAPPVLERQIPLTAETEPIVIDIDALEPKMEQFSRDVETPLQITSVKSIAGHSSFSSISEYIDVNRPLVELLDNGQLHMCDLCGILFTDEAMLAIHQGLHKDKTSFRCIICDFVGRNKYDFSMHFMNRHR